MDNFEAILKKIDAATTATGNRVAALIAKMNPTAEQQAEANAIVAHLEGIAADPENPTPEPAS